MTAPRPASRPVLLAALMLAAAASGCLGASAPEPAPPAPAGVPDALRLAECDGFRASTLTRPSAAMPPAAPPGWEPSPTATGTIYLLGLECTRLSFGAIERGPVRLVLEAHGHFTPPPACVADARAAFLLVSSLQVDDAEVADRLRAIGLPATAAEVDVGFAGAAGATQRTWVWGPAGEPPSQLTFVRAGDGQPESQPQRLLWTTAGASDGPATSGSMDIVYERTGRVSSAGAGVMRPPLLLAAAMPEGQFAGPAAPVDDLSAEGAIRLYADGACKEPLP